MIAGAYVLAIIFGFVIFNFNFTEKIFNFVCELFIICELLLALRIYLNKPKWFIKMPVFILFTALIILLKIYEKIMSVPFDMTTSIILFCFCLSVFVCYELLHFAVLKLFKYDFTCMNRFVETDHPADFIWSLVTLIFSLALTVGLVELYLII